MQELKAHASPLRELSLWYRDNVERLRIRTEVLFETQDTKGVRVVDETSSDPGLGHPVPIDADHFSICKPPARGAQVFKTVKQFIEECLGSRADQSIPLHKTTAPVPKADSPHKDKNRAARIFLSYRRRAAQDARLAQALRAGLDRVGYEVFIDVGTAVGIDRSAEIQRRIHWCDYLIVLLSEESVQSEMLQGEVRLAHQGRKKDGRPHILPVRVRFNSPLDYELDSYLGRLPYVLWQEDGDDEQVLKAVLSSIETGGVLPERDNRPRPAPNPNDLRPRPVADLGLLRQPTGAIPVDDPFYIRRPVDESMEGFARTNGVTLVIKGARQVGKSSLLMRYLATCEQAGKQFVLIDLQSVAPREVEELPAFLRFMAERVFKRVGVGSEAIPELTSPGALGDLLDEKVLRHMRKSLVIALDEVDRLVGSPIQETGIAMFRHWHNRRAEPGSHWKNVDLALSVATEPAILMSDPTQSPFNVGDVLRLDSFDRAALVQLNNLYQAGLTDIQLDQLLQLVGGQPYLTRLALYRLVGPQKLAFDVLLQRATDEDGPFGEHLRSKLLLLHQAKLEDAMSEIIRTGVLSKKDHSTYYRLQAAGFVRREEGKVLPANLLYARFFKTIL
jgi:hypothetical protein